jgi:lipoprotein-anchoring transpeptidase ErfK/SrfK
VSAAPPVKRPRRGRISYHSTFNSQLSISLRIHVHVPSQTLDLLDDAGALVARFAISTSRYGLGAEPGSNRTPTGRFRIAEKIGDGAPPGEIFVSRVATGRCGSEDDDADHVQTRILWLDGLDEANRNTKDRYIYIHGTNVESLLGTPASHGCVRMNNSDMIELYDRVQAGDEVRIEGGEE